MSEKRYIAEPVEVRAITNDKGTFDYIVGRGIVFNKWSQVLTAERPDGSRFQFIEKIEPRAMQGVDLSNVVSMVNHKLTLGKRAKGTMDVEIKEDGVHYQTLVPNTTVGNDARENVSNGNLEGSSFQFSLAKGGDSWDKSKTPYERTITQFKEVREMGPVEYPAYIDTTAAMRSFDDVEVIETRETDFERLEKLYKAHKIKQK